MPNYLSYVTPAQRQELQARWEKARGLMTRAGSPAGRDDVEQIHKLLEECVAQDPVNTVYLDAFLLNLRVLRAQSKGWWKILFGPKQPKDHGLRGLRHELQDKAYGEILLSLADYCVRADAPESEIRYLQEALFFSPQSRRVLLQLARALLRQGRFDESRATVQTLRKIAGDDDEVRSLLNTLDGTLDSNENEHWPAEISSLQEAAAKSTAPDDHLALATALVKVRRFDEAEAVAAKALSLSGGDLAVREKVEDISLGRLQNNLAIARRLVEHEPSPAHRQTLHRWEEEFGRLVLATLNARSERFPQDIGLKLEVAVRLKRAGNYSGAIQRLEEIAADQWFRPNVLLELGECWQHLRQFEKALGRYSQVIAAAEELNQPEPLKLALYRAGSLAAAMQQTSAARNWFERVVSLDPEFKDARAKLLQLET
ncbi:MAG: tetratricopeptide repeat protein [Pirellulaceae bacterium]